jgi:hypothetical protein
LKIILLTPMFRTTSAAASSISAAATSTGPSTPSPSTAGPIVGNYEEIGCYTDATKSRALTLASKINYSIMTWEVCADFCSSYGALYFGVEYGGEVCLSAFLPGHG